MRYFSADLHIHTVLSPCGDLGMSPSKITAQARNKKLDIIGITDHNSMLQYPVVKSLCEKAGIVAICGVEINTREEVHCLAYFDHPENIADFQNYLEKHILRIPNKPEKFGYQVVVDAEEMITTEIEYLLTASLDSSIDEVSDEVHRLGGIVIPAHVDRPSFSIISQLGFISAGFPADALEISPNTDENVFRLKYPELSKYSLVRNSDAHYPGQVGSSPTLFFLEKPSLKEIKLALSKTGNRHVILPSL